MTVQIIQGDSREKLLDLATDSIDSVVTDPPYALVSITKRWGPGCAPPTKEGVYSRASSGFMGKQWDTGETAFDPAFWAEVLRVLKPGGHLIAFGGTRTYHRLVCAIEDGGFEIRDQLAWIFGSGFPKSHDVSKGIDKAAGITPEDTGVGFNAAGIGTSNGGSIFRSDHPEYKRPERVTDNARQWQGWGTALKPAQEPICLARKPLESTVAANVLKHGTGALNIDASRIGTERREYKGGMGRFNAAAQAQGFRPYENGIPSQSKETFSATGRWPANVIHDGSPEVLAGFPETQASSDRPRNNGEFKSVAKGRELPHVTGGHADTGGSAARFFYTPKADKLDRLDSKHPTVKPVDLMAYLIKLVTPPGGTVLDPFAGSGSTGMAAMREGFDAILIEREAEYVADIQRRLDHVHGHDTPLFAEISA